MDNVDGVGEDTKNLGRVVVKHGQGPVGGIGMDPTADQLKEPLLPGKDDGPKVEVQPPVSEPVNTLNAEGFGQVKLSNGMILTVKEPPGSTTFRALSVVPSDMCQNGTMISMIQAFLYITHINGVPWPPIQAFKQVESLANKIGDEGIILLQAELGMLFPSSDDFRERMKKRMENLQNL